MILAMKSINKTVHDIAVKNDMEYYYNYDKLEALYTKTRRFLINLFEAKNINLKHYGKYLKNQEYGYSINDTVENILKPYITNNRFPCKKEIEERLNNNDYELELLIEEFINENFDYEARQKIVEDLTEEALNLLIDWIKGISPGNIQIPDVEKLFNDFKHLHDETTKPAVHFCGLSQKTTTILKFLILKEQIDKLLKFIESTNKSFKTINSL